MSSDSISAITQRLVAFRRERNWECDHSPRNLAESVVIEAAELLECFQWDGKGEREMIADECADVAIYVFQVAERCGIDLGEAMVAKIAHNAERYPVEESRSLW